MWSKQADPNRANKNMTSFRNKITNRKRKNSNQVANATETDVKETPATPSTVNDVKKSQQQRHGKNRARNRNRKDSVGGGGGGGVVGNKKVVDDDVTTIVVEKDEEVVLRNAVKCDKDTINNSLKRYSDSFVIEEKIEENMPAPVLTRAASGFFVIDHARKARRFSDLFKTSAMRLSSSTECLKNAGTKLNNKQSKTITDENKSIKSNANTAQKNNKQNRTTKQEKPETEPKTTSTKTQPKKTQSETSNSYLKRVKSKIYKSKSDDTSKIDVEKSKKPKTKLNLDVNGRIPEDEVAVTTPQGLRKSLTHFDFRLTRQHSNLERMLPKSRRSVDATDGCAAPPLDGVAERPILAKAKSSSAINLNLLRTRRSKIMEQAAAKRQAAASCKEEFDFIAFGGAQGKWGSTTSLNRFPSWFNVNKGEAKGDVKPGQPVSRSGSDRRPDAVHEENLKHQDSGASQDSQHESAHKNDTNAPESSVSLPASGSKRKVGSNINRSESVKEQSEKRKQRRNISDPSHNTSCEVDLDGRQGLAKNTDSGSSSNSSISCNGRLSESPCNSVDVVHQTAQIRTNTDSDSDMDGETDPLNWQQLVTEEELKNLNLHEKKRQDVINELFHTESSHVRFLKVLYKIFYKKLQESQVLKQDELNLIFPNIREMLDIHTEFNKEMRRKRKEDPLVKELGEMLLKMFAGAQGESLQKAAATFCERQQLALEFIKKRRERDSKFDAVLTNCEKKRQCRRLQLQGIIPTEMQRLSKYPLLLERLVKSVEANTDTENSEELTRLQRAHNASKDILNYVNEAAKVALNHHRLEEIQKHLDTSSFERADHEIVNDFRTLDLTRYRLVMEGSMQLRRPNKPVVPVHILLLEEMVVILHREGDRFLLKFFQSGSPAQPQPLSPIIKINTLLVRINAVCKNALFLVNTSTNNSQMYDLIAEDESKREVWFKHFSDAADAYNRREGRSKRHLPAADDSDSEVVHELPSTGDVSERAEAVTVDGDRTGAEEEEEAVKDVGEGEEKEAESGEGAETKEEDEETPAMVAGGGAAQPTRVTAEEWPLVQPSQVSVVVPPVHVAESTLTHLEQIRRKDALVKQALADKEGLVADMLHIPREHFQHIADMAGEEAPSTGGDLTHRILASIYQVSTLQKAVNEALNVTETEAVAACGGRQPACVSQEQMGSSGAVAVPSIPASLVADVAAALNAQLTKLLSDSKTMEEDRDRLRKELHKVTERYHEELHLHGPVQLDDSVSDESTQDIFCEASSGEKE